MRKPFIIANWKMNKNVQESVEFAKTMQDAVPLGEDVGIAAQALALYSMRAAIGDSPLRIIAQNAGSQPSGAQTGEISIESLADAGVSHVILGHLERRLLFHESNEEIGKKVATALQFGVTPIICTDEEKIQVTIDGEQHYFFHQLTSILQGLSPKQMRRVIISYEPRYAVGAKQAASPDMAETACWQIRQSIADHFGAAVANEVRILYGGSVTPQNIYGIVSQPDVDGTLIGRASLNVQSFLQMVNCFQAAKQQKLTAI